MGPAGNRRAGPRLELRGNMDLGFLDAATWLNPPPDQGRDANGLWVETGADTDFWRHTHYGFVHENGHALMAAVAGDFTAVVTFDAAWTAPFDQAGIMLWQDAGHWIKAGVELSDGILNLGAVVTRERSDWNCVPVPGLSGPQTLRLTRRGDAVALEYLATRWRLIRLADFPAGPARFGIMACSPSRAGLLARFSAIGVGPAQDVVHAA